MDGNHIDVDTLRELSFGYRKRVPLPLGSLRCKKNVRSVEASRGKARHIWIYGL